MTPCARLALYTLLELASERFAAHETLAALVAWREQLRTRDDVRRCCAQFALPTAPFASERELASLDAAHLRFASFVDDAPKTSVPLSATRSLRAAVEADANVDDNISASDARRWLGVSSQRPTALPQASEAQRESDESDVDDVRDDGDAPPSQGTRMALSDVRQQIAERQLALSVAPLIAKLRDERTATLDATLDELVDLIERGTDVRCVLAVRSFFDDRSIGAHSSRRCIE